MSKLAIVIASLAFAATALAENDLREHQLEKNARRRSRQAEAIQNMDDDNKAEAVEKAHQRNKNVRERQRNLNEEIDERD